MLGRLVEAGSTYAGSIDTLFVFITVLVGVWFIAAEAVLFWLIIRFREKPDTPAMYITGKEPQYKRWVSIPHMLIIVCDVFVIYGAVQVWYNIKQNLPPADLTVKIVGQQWAWSFVHPGADRVLGTDDDIETVDELHIASDTLYHFQLESRDVLHSFSVPLFRLKQDALPGRTITGWFEATMTGEYDIQCAEMCGIGHGIMAGRIFIETPDKHAEWVASASK